MDETLLRALLDDIAIGRTTVEAGLNQLRQLPFADLGFAKIDHHRNLRQPFPEAIYAPGKSPEHCAAIVSELLTNGSGPVILSRADEHQSNAAIAVNPDGVRSGRTIIWRPRPSQGVRIPVLTAGTADLTTAEETSATLQALGIEAPIVADVGVSGVHRLFASLEVLDEAECVIVVAGMEGALPSLVGGIVGIPVIAVPTSVGYGASFHGITALLAMLSSCAAGITVVGIDNGFGAACAAARIIDVISKSKSQAEIEHAQ